MTFRFHLSYQDETEYTVIACPDSRRVAWYREPHPDTLAYMRKTANPTLNWEGEVLSRFGGVANTSGNYRMTPELYGAFVDWLRSEHDRVTRELQSQPERYGEYTPEPLEIPRPIYYDRETKRYQTEPWYQPEPIRDPEYHRETNPNFGR